MRTLTLTVTIAIMFALSSCTATRQSTTQVAANFLNRQSVVATTNEIYPAKNPEKIAVYTPRKTPHAAYRVIGIAKISKYNMLGMQRQEQTMQDMMKNLAASIGGDGIMNVSHDPKFMHAKIIAFQKILI